MTHSLFSIGSALTWELAWTSILPRCVCCFPFLLKCQVLPQHLSSSIKYNSAVLCFSSSSFLLLSLVPYSFSPVLGVTKSIYGNILSFTHVRHKCFQFVTNNTNRLEKLRQRLWGIPICVASVMARVWFPDPMFKEVRRGLGKWLSD